MFFQQSAIIDYQNYNGSTNIKPMSPLLYRCRGCNQNLTSNNPATKYQIQKLIQNTVRVPSSLYSMNLAGLNVYQSPIEKYRVIENSGTPYVISPGVNWNQMSDRKEPHVQVVNSGSGSTYHSSSTKRMITRCRPGALSPGGVGVDIKHNSYDRYLNRIKGKGPLRRGPIPKIIESPYIPFNRAYPIYGDKVVKTSIVSGCNCPEPKQKNDYLKDAFSKNEFQDKIYSVTYEFQVDQIVYAYKNGSKNKSKAIILSITGNIYTIKYLDEDLIEEKEKGDLIIYKDDTCKPLEKIINLYDTSGVNIVCTKLVSDYLIERGN